MNCGIAANVTPVNDAGRRSNPAVRPDEWFSGDPWRGFSFFFFNFCPQENRRSEDRPNAAGGRNAVFGRGKRCRSTTGRACVTDLGEKINPGGLDACVRRVGGRRSPNANKRELSISVPPLEVNKTNNKSPHIKKMSSLVVGVCLARTSEQATLLTVLYLSRFLLRTSESAHRMT